MLDNHDAAVYLIRAVAFVDEGVCPLIGLCAVLYPLAGAVWGKSKIYERASLYAGGLTLVLYTAAALAIALKLDADDAFLIAVRGIIAAVAAGLITAILAALVQAFALNPARRIGRSLERAREERRAQLKRREEEGRRRQQEIEAQKRNTQSFQFEERARKVREAEDERRQAAARIKNAVRYEFQLRYVAARPHLNERLSQSEFDALLQTTLEPTDPAELETRKAALGQMMNDFAQEAIAKQPPASVEQLVADYQRRHAEIDASSVAADMKEKMHRWLNKEESQAISRFMMMRYE
jgi:hypothetical protein